MPDGLRNPTSGPDAMWSKDLAPTRGQHEAISRLCCELLGFDMSSRYDATVAITRLQLALGSDDAPPRKLPEVEAF